jgi:molybdopterin/thiamine biosynthesis adenylyltransferase
MDRAPGDLPLACDRCGADVVADDHFLVSLDVWRDGQPRCREGDVPGRLCDACGGMVAREILDLARRLHLTSTSGGRRVTTGLGQEILDASGGEAP